MKLTFFGAAGEVTGSCLRVETAGARFLVDCGLFQGAMRGPENAPAKNRAAYARDLGPLDFVLLTHAHLDHSGLLPRFVAARGREPMIWCTKPTADLVPVMLKDSAHIQSREADRPRSRRRDPRRAPATEEPLYTMEDVDRLACRTTPSSSRTRRSRCACAARGTSSARRSPRSRSPRPAAGGAG